MAEKRKLSVEKIVQMVREYKCGGSQCGKFGPAEQGRRMHRAGMGQEVRSGGSRGIFPHERNRVYSSEEKLKAVCAYLTGEGSLREIAQKYHLRSKKQLQNWLKVYNAHGDFNSVKFSGGGSYMKQGRETTQQERMEIVKECIAGGKNYGAMALKYRVSYQQVRNWTLRYEAMGEAGL